MKDHIRQVLEASLQDTRSRKNVVIHLLKQAEKDVAEREKQLRDCNARVAEIIEHLGYDPIEKVFPGAQ